MTTSRVFKAGVRLLLVGGLLLATTGCPNQVLVQEKTVADADEQQATCKVAKDPLNPLIVEWPGTSKVELDSASKRGVVVVSYVGCTMKVLSSCDAGGDYQFTAVTPARDKIQIADQNELYARLPLGVASLKGELEMGSSLELDYIAVGQRIAEKPPRSLSGECEGATHYVRTITVGAYSLDAKAQGRVGGGVDVQGVGIGGGRKEQTRRLRGSGEVEECSGSPDSVNCAAVLQLGLSPLSASKGGAVTAAGFGSNIAPLTNIPTVSELTDVNSVGAQSLRNVDVDYLTAVQDAKRSEKTQNTQAKIDAWSRVKDMRAEGAFFSIAETRVTEWTEVHAAEKRRREQLEKLRTQYNSDKSKLDQLMRIDDDLVSKAQKEAYQKEFTAVYAAYQSDLQEVGVRTSSSSTGSAQSATPYSSSGSSNDSSGSAMDSPKVDEEFLVLRVDTGALLQGYTFNTDGEDYAEGSEPHYDSGALTVGGQLILNLSGGDDLAIGVKGYGHFFPLAVISDNGDSGGSVDAGGFDAGIGLRLAGNISDNVGMNLGLDAGLIGFSHPATDPQCGAEGETSTTYDPSALGGGLGIFWGFDFYPMKFLSIGATAALGWSSLSAQACSNAGGTSQVVDISGDGFHLGGIGSIGVHF